MATATTIPLGRHFMVDAMSDANVTPNQAVNYCILTLDIRHPTPEQIETASSTLKNMRQKIIKLGEEELKSLFVGKAAGRGIKFKGNVVSNWNDLREAWNSHISLILCQDIYEIMICFFITDGDWMTNKAREIKERLGIVIDSNSPTSSTDDCFVVEILKKKCFYLTWKTFGARRKKGSHGVGLTQKKSLKGHPMGDVTTKDCKTNKFVFQNVQNWEEALCALDPVARMIQEEKDQLPVGDVSYFYYQDVAGVIKSHAERHASNEANAKASSAPRKKLLVPANKAKLDDDDDDSQIMDKCGGLPKTSNTFRAQVGNAEKVTGRQQAPDSIVTTRQQEHERSPAVITTSTHRSDSPKRRASRVSAKDATNDSDIITGTRSMIQVQIDEGVFETEDFGDLSTLRPSVRTEVSRCLFLQFAIVPVCTLLIPSMWFTHCVYRDPRLPLLLTQSKQNWRNTVETRN
jgi:hypothetical protein